MDGFEVLANLRKDGHPADIVVLSAHGSVDKVVQALQDGADDFLTKPADFDLLEQVVQKSVERRKVRLSLEALAERSGVTVLAAAPAMKEVLATAERVAAADTTVIISGESGTGKQVVAEYIHARSPRRDGPFVYVNCVAISNDLIESKRPPAGRPSWTRSVTSVPTSRPSFCISWRPGNSNAWGATRPFVWTAAEDLYYRLNVISLRVPPLSERPEDIPLLGEAFLTRFATELKRGPMRLAPRTLEVMQGYAWPGNVRQLKNAMERMVVLAVKDVLTPDLLPPEVLDNRDVGAGDAEGSDIRSDLPYRDAVVEFKRRLIGRDDCGGNQTKAAEKLGLQRSYLNRMIKDLDLRSS